MKFQRKKSGVGKKKKEVRKFACQVLVITMTSNFTTPPQNLFFLIRQTLTIIKKITQINSQSSLWVEFSYIQDLRIFSSHTTFLWNQREKLFSQTEEKDRENRLSAEVPCLQSWRRWRVQSLQNQNKVRRCQRTTSRKKEKEEKGRGEQTEMTWHIWTYWKTLRFYEKIGTEIIKLSPRKKNVKIKKNVIIIHSMYY